MTNAFLGWAEVAIFNPDFDCMLASNLLLQMQLDWDAGYLRFDRL